MEVILVGAQDTVTHAALTRKMDDGHAGQLNPAGGKERKSSIQADVREARGGVKEGNRLCVGFQVSLRSHVLSNLKQAPVALII